MSKKLILISMFLVFCVVPVGFAQAPQFPKDLHENSRGMKGDLLIFPYYDVRTINGKQQDTLFMIINETSDLGRDQLSGTYTPDPNDQGIVAKLRFREWDKSEEVFDCDIWLSDGDVWVGVVTLNPSTGLANIWSPDYVVVDYDALTFTVQKVLINGFDFITQNISLRKSSTYPPSGWSEAQMTQVGYFEVIGEERTKTKITVGTTNKVGRISLEVGYPDCPNVLMGQAYIVRVEDGVAMGYNAFAFTNFHSKGIFSAPGALTPALTDAEMGLDQLEFAMSKGSIFAAYEIDPAIDGKTSIIITFPTKYFRYDWDPINKKRPIISGSDNPFRALDANDGEVIFISVWDRDENRIIPEKKWWSPPPEIQPLSLPYEVNIIGVYSGTSPVLPPTSRDNVVFPAGEFKNGWIWIELLDENKSQSAFPKKNTYFYLLGHAFGLRDNLIGYMGLPALALQLQEFSNFNVGGYYGEIERTWSEPYWENYQGYFPYSP